MNLLKAYAFGLTIALAIGPIALLILSNGLRYGAAAGSFTVAALMALFAAALSPWLHKPAILRRLNLASGLAIAGFGLFGAWPVIRSAL